MIMVLQERFLPCSYSRNGAKSYVLEWSLFRNDDMGNMGKSLHVAYESSFGFGVEPSESCAVYSVTFMANASCRKSSVTALPGPLF